MIVWYNLILRVLDYKLWCIILFNRIVYIVFFYLNITMFVKNIEKISKKKSNDINTSKINKWISIYILKNLVM